MWWEYVIIFTGLILAASYVLWTFLRSFRVKGNCCGSACAGPPADDATPSRRIRVTPLVELKSPPKSAEQARGPRAPG